MSDGFEGMTVNERLLSAGLISEFDAAINAALRGAGPEAAIELLCRVSMTAEQAAGSVSRILANPGPYGYPHR